LKNQVSVLHVNLNTGLLSDQLDLIELITVSEYFHFQETEIKFQGVTALILAWVLSAALIQTTKVHHPQLLVISQ